VVLDTGEESGFRIQESGFSCGQPSGIRWQPSADPGYSLRSVWAGSMRIARATGGSAASVAVAAIVRIGSDH